MTAPFQRPSVEGVLGNHEKRIGTLEAVAPPNPAAGVRDIMPTKWTMLGNEWWLYYDSGFHSGFAPVRDSAAPFGGYFQSTAQNAYFLLGCPLGPVDSRWCIDLWWSEGSDYGKFDMEWQTTTAANTAGGVDLSDQSIAEPDEGGTWYNTSAGTTIWQINAYTVAPHDDHYDDQICLFTPQGAPGTMLSANGTDGNGVDPWQWQNTALMNGGADGNVWWWMRLKVKTKDASSSGYRCRIHAIRIRREAAFGWTPF